MLAFTLAVHATCRAESVSVDFGTSNAVNWLATAGGATNVPAWQLGGHITVTSNAFSSGAFLPGGNVGSFNGFWTAAFSFFLPSTASNVTLVYSNLSADDRVVLMLNGNPVDATGTKTVAGTNSGLMVLTNGAFPVAYNFNGPVGSPAGSINNGFLLGATNVLKAIVNNTGKGFDGSSLANLSATDGTTFAVSGTVSYSFTPPSLGIVSSGGIVTVSWPTNYSGYQLQTATNLTGSNNWTSVAASNGSYVGSTTNRARFFRLAGH